MTSLESLLEGNREALQTAIAEAEDELLEVRRRVSELEHLIVRGRMALGEIEPPGETTLHRALERILAEEANRWLTAGELAQLVNDRGLYRMRDGRPVESSQIHARVRNYDRFFEKVAGKIRLRYTFQTRVLSSKGAYGAAVTSISPADGSLAPMHVEARVAYSVSIPDGHTLESYAAEQSNELAHQVVANDGFSPGVWIRGSITTMGLDTTEVDADQAGA